MIVDTDSTQASVAGGDGQNGNNVLFEPEIYRPEPQQNIDMQDDDVRSVSTHAGAHTSMVSNYKTDLDPSLFAANKM